MGFWECDDGTMVEIIFDDQGDFVKFGDDAKKEDAEKAEKEIIAYLSGGDMEFRLVKG